MATFQSISCGRGGGRVPVVSMAAVVAWSSVEKYSCGAPQCEQKEDWPAEAGNSPPHRWQNSVISMKLSQCYGRGKRLAELEFNGLLNRLLKGFVYVADEVAQVAVFIE
jgi:hypothetical protein